MEKLDQYRQHIKQLLSDDARHGPSEDEVDTELIFDTDRDHYQVVSTSWKNRTLNGFRQGFRFSYWP